MQLVGEPGVANHDVRLAHRERQVQASEMLSLVIGVGHKDLRHQDQGFAPGVHHHHGLVELSSVDGEVCGFTGDVVGCGAEAFCVCLARGFSEPLAATDVE